MNTILNYDYASLLWPIAAALPDRCDEVVLTDDPVMILDQKHQKIEHLRFEPNQLIRAFEFAPIRVERVRLEEI